MVSNLNAPSERATSAAPQVQLQPRAWLHVGPLVSKTCLAYRPQTPVDIRVTPSSKADGATTRSRDTHESFYDVPIKPP
jgi:hypothetical protein